jgi:rubredoxin
MRLSFFPLVHSTQTSDNPASKDRLMPGTATYSHLTKHPLVATFRTLVWIEVRHFHGWRCSECAWVFNASGPPEGHSLKEMMENYERLRDKTFAAHVCAEHPKATKTKPLIVQAG